MNNIRSLITLALLSLLPIGMVAASTQDTTPKDLTCREFIDLNPKAMSPVAFWMLSDEPSYKGGDSVYLNETETVAVPAINQLCNKNREANSMNLRIN